jgi:hypothetical protein
MRGADLWVYLDDDDDDDKVFLIKVNSFALFAQKTSSERVIGDLSHLIFYSASMDFDEI